VFTRSRLIQVARLGVSLPLATIIALGLVGQALRDRSVALGLLFYLPLLPASVAALVFEIIRRGRALPRARFLLGALGAIGATCSAIPMIGSGTIGKYEPADTEVTLLQWNVLWGGGPFRSERTWAAERAEIHRRDPDLIILSELPRAEWLSLLLDELGPGASCAGVEHDARSNYWYRMAVCSRWPVRLEKQMRLPGGAAMSVRCDIRGHTMRVLVVDGKSNPFASRLPFLRAIAELCRAAAFEGRPYDVVAGDFNTPARSVGFDLLTAQGYSLASRSARGWRATFPSFLPIYDIDHVWLRPGLHLRSSTVFTGAASDHRGQFASVLLNSAIAAPSQSER
jgi:endonuclease/exonuclease/phosphatase family metal-dependent hydrolase